METLNVEPLLELMIGKTASAAVCAYFIHLLLLCAIFYFQLSGTTLWHKLIAQVDRFKKQQSESISSAMWSVFRITNVLCADLY